MYYRTKLVSFKSRILYMNEAQEITIIFQHHDNSETKALL